MKLRLSPRDQVSDDMLGMELMGKMRQATTNSQAESNGAAVRRIVLTGFMGCGKSTVGPLLAKELGWNFIDADDVIEAETGMAISDFFAQHGESAFRAREQATIARLVGEESGLVLALGGGAIEHAETRELLLTTPGTLLVHLEVELATTLKRCHGTEHIRPILADQMNLAARYERRMPFYRLAHLNLAVDDLKPRQVVAEILVSAGLDV